MKREKKINAVWVTVMIGSFLLLAVLEAYIPVQNPFGAARVSCEAASSDNGHSGIIRFHVQANSDSEEDQRLKLAVKDSVFPRLEKGIARALAHRLAEAGGTLSEAQERSLREEVSRDFIAENLGNIEAWAGECMESYCCGYRAKARLGVTYIPPKTYDGVFFPAGNYEALTITLGEGKGQNWWCVIFPPLCLVDCENSAYKEMFSEEGDRLVLKSRILELLGEESCQAGDAEGNDEGEGEEVSDCYGKKAGRIHLPGLFQRRGTAAISEDD